MKSPLPKKAYENNALTYKILANPKRLEILNCLARKDMSCEELNRIIKSSKANLSQHLSVLRLAGLVKATKNGLNVNYRIIDARIVKPCAILHDLRASKKIQ
jgi:ArsR family transcriptional regulator